MGKCTFTIVSGTEMVNRHLSYRLCKLFACHVRSPFGALLWVQLLTFSTFKLSSIRIEPPSEAYGSKSRQTGVSVTVHSSTASDFARSKSDQAYFHSFDFKTRKSETSA